MINKLWNFLFDEDNGDGAGGGGAAAAATAAGTGGGTGGDGGSSGSGDGGGGSSSGAGTAGVSWINSDLTFKEGWQNDLPDDKFSDYKATLANFRDLPTLAKSLKDSMTAARARTEGMVKVPVAPAKDAKPEAVEAYKAELAAYRKATGIPDKPEDYNLKAPEKLLPGVAWREDQAKEFATLAHEIGLTPAQAARLSEFQMGITSRDFSKWEADAKATDEAHDKEIRDAFGEQLEKRMVDAKRAATAFFGNPDGPQTRAQLVLGLAKIADAISEDKLPSGAQVSNKLGPESAATDLMRSPAYTDHSDPRHKETVAEVNRLMRQAYPDKR